MLDMLQMNLGFYGATDTGVIRAGSLNEDTIYSVHGICQSTLQPFGLFVVADGMGGHADGKEASALAVKELSGFLLPRLYRNEIHSVQEGMELLRCAVQVSNDLLYEHNRAYRQDSGTTITALLIKEPEHRYS